MQLDRLHQVLWPLAMGADGQRPNLRAVSEIVRIMERRARLFGLDAPKPTGCGHGVVTIEELDADIARLEAEIRTRDEHRVDQDEPPDLPR